MDNSPPGSSVHGILQARILEGLPFTPPRESSQPKDLTQVPCIAGRFFIIWATRKAQTCTKKKVMITVWWPAAGLIHYSFLNPDKIITSEKYAQQINEMHQKLQLALVNRKGSILHDNTQQHIAQPMLQKLNKLGCKILPHPPYSTASYQLTTTS